MDIDPTAIASAEAAAAAVFARYEGLIAEVSQNLGLSREQRAAAIVSLRQRQKAEAAAASKAIMAAAKDAVRARREMMKRRRRRSMKRRLD